MNESEFGRYYMSRSC